MWPRPAQWGWQYLFHWILPAGQYSLVIRSSRGPDHNLSLLTTCRVPPVLQALGTRLDRRSALPSRAGAWVVRVGQLVALARAVLHRGM